MKIFWKDQKCANPVVFIAGIDTTFALYNKQRNYSERTDLPPPHHGHQIFPSLRTGYPYVARHLSWYWEILKKISIIFHMLVLIPVGLIIFVL